MTNPIQDALYYPNIHITNDRWLKSTLLSFPHVIRMTPSDYVPDDGPLVHRLSRSFGSRGQPLVGRYDLNTAAAYHVAQVLVRKLESDLAADDGFRRRFEAAHYFEEFPPHHYRSWPLHQNKLTRRREGNPILAPVLHRNKLGYILRNTLVDSGLAIALDGKHGLLPDGRRREDGWLAVHPTLLTAIMSCAAAAVAKEDGLEIVTDRGTVHDSLVSYDTEAIYDAIVHGGPTSSKAGRRIDTELAQLVILNNFDVDALSVADLVAMSREEDALYDFRQKVAATVQRIPQMDSRDRLERELQHHANRLFEEWESSRSNMSTFSRRFFGIDLAKEGKISEVLHNLAGYSGGAVIGAKLLGLVPGLALAVVIRGATIWSGMKKEEKGNQLRYLTMIEQNVTRDSRLLGWAGTFISAGL